MRHQALQRAHQTLRHWQYTLLDTLEQWYNAACPMPRVAVVPVRSRMRYRHPW